MDLLLLFVSYENYDRFHLEFFLEYRTHLFNIFFYKIRMNLLKSQLRKTYHVKKGVFFLDIS